MSIDNSLVGQWSFLNAAFLTALDALQAQDSCCSHGNP